MSGRPPNATPRRVQRHVLRLKTRCAILGTMPMAKNLRLNEGAQPCSCVQSRPTTSLSDEPLTAISKYNSIAQLCKRITSAEEIFDDFSPRRRWRIGRLQRRSRRDLAVNALVQSVQARR